VTVFSGAELVPGVTEMGEACCYPERSPRLFGPVALVEIHRV
jgi:hypothetical protein